MKKTIVLCASTSFYKQVIFSKDQLQKLGFRVTVPYLAEIMEKSGNFDFSFYKKAWKDKDAEKGQAIMRHFKKIQKGDAILVLNYKKRGIDGYIGPNLLMEMGLAFHLRKPIYLLNKVKRDNPFADEIFGMKPIFLFGNLKRITLD